MKKYYRSLLASATLAMMTTACSDSSSSSSTLTGQLMYSGLSNLTYKTATQEGKLDDAGTFKYLEGETVSFSLGNLQLVEDVPAREYISFLEFGVDERQDLDDGTVKDGVSTHTEAEVTVSKHNFINNVSRFIYLMGDTVTSNSTGNAPIVITDRTIEQINEYLLTAETPIDFHVPISEFEAEGSPFNTLLKEVCFYPADFLECEVPPTQEEIDAKESKFGPNKELREDYDREQEYKEDLEAKRRIINSAVRTAAKKKTDQTAVAVQLDAQSIARDLGSQIYLTTYSGKYKEGDSAPRNIEIHSLKPNFTITDMEVFSFNERIAVIDGFDTAGKTVTFSPIGKLGEETTIVLNIKQQDDYRWYKKTFRVQIQ